MTTSFVRRRTVTFINKYCAAEITGLSVETLKKLRLAGQLIEGVHWVAFSKRCVRYNQELLEDWAATRTSPEQHQRAVDAYLESLPSNQSKQRRRPSYDKRGQRG